jgi:hypothetical protein
MTDYSYLDEPFKGTPESGGGGGENVPDGNYRVVLDSVEIRTSQAGNEYLNWDMIIQGGDYPGRHLFTGNSFPKGDDELAKIQQQLGFLKHNLKTCGVDIDSPKFSLSKFLDDKLVSLYGIVLDVTAKTKKDKSGVDRQNVYINELVSESRDDAGTPGVDYDPFEGE